MAEEVLEEGAQIVADIKKNPIEMLGHVTSSYYSPNLKKSIALGVGKAMPSGYLSNLGKLATG